MLLKILSFISLFSGSLALERLREAVLGRDGRNLADVAYMSGKVENLRQNLKVPFSTRVLPYRGRRVSQCIATEVCQENPYIQVYS